ncbi:hypothetical protein LFL96_34675 (plasmid) [Paraburkholderia sp. D15]|uniref:hypothetical protein n=1 Tax=Paraburkholderia sp. D15 TaxID=2880218 RepID=UPI00247AFB7B|nr:hypothetical protein [Paraburkholderia sp. D15]WGS55098.1 hypothetical protein LFL96_34675 [Paraburkholderia sp. D15]
MAWRDAVLPRGTSARNFSEPSLSFFVPVVIDVHESASRRFSLLDRASKPSRRRLDISCAFYFSGEKNGEAAF